MTPPTTQGEEPIDTTSSVKDEDLCEEEQLQYEELILENPKSKKKSNPDDYVDDSTIDGFSECGLNEVDLLPLNAGSDIDLEYQLQQSVLDHFH